MTSLIRLVYASRSTVPPAPTQQGLNRDVARILAKSRKNNARLQVVGGLLFGDGNFLQCLEGEDQVVDALYNRIEADRRHCDVTLLARRRIDRRSFGAWSMKYAPGEQAMADMLHSWGMERFDPYQLSPQRVDAAVTYMLQGDDTVVDTQPGGLDDDAAASPPPGPSSRPGPRSGPATRDPVVFAISPSPGVLAGVQAAASAAAPALPRRPTVPRWLVWAVAASAAAGLALWLRR